MRWLFRNGFGLALLASSLLPRLLAAGLPDPDLPSSMDRFSPPIAKIAEDLFGTGQFAAALHEVDAALKSNPHDAELLCLSGDILFRESRFSEAERSYQAVLATESTNSRQAYAYWGLGRLAIARSRSAEARENFAAAFRLAPGDLDIIWSYAEFAPDTQAHVALLRRFLQLAPAAEIQRREKAAANLRVFEQLGARKASHVTSTNTSYQFKLSDFSSLEGSLKGVSVDVRINGSHPLRMLLDSGAEGVFLNTRVARKLKLEPVVDARVQGFGKQETAGEQDSAGLMLASTLSISERRAGRDWRIENLAVTVMDLNWLPEVDGVIGTEVFKDFLVRIDAHSKVLDLLPYQDGVSADPTDKGVAPMYRFGHRLLVRGSGITNTAEGLSVTTSGGPIPSGYFMLDTGASFTVLAARSSGKKQVASKANEVSLRGAQGYVAGATPSVPVRVAIAEQQYLDSNPVSFDLTSMSQQAGVEIAGILGYPLLRQSILTINYRDGLVAFASNRH